MSDSGRSIDDCPHGGVAETCIKCLAARAVAAEQQCERILKTLKHIQSTTSDSYCEEVARDALREFKTRVK